MSEDQKAETKRLLDLKLMFVDFSKKFFISALHGTGVGNLFDTVAEVYAATMTNMGTAHLTKILEDAVTAHQPPLVRGRRIKLKYAHQGGTNPPTIIVHGNQIEEIPGSYKRYLTNAFRAAIGIEGTPIKIEFRGGDNPFKGKKNVLTERQVKKRKRLMRHVK
jgi:GTP-binding protein